MGPVDLTSQQSLNSIENRAVNERFVLPGIPLAFVRYLAEVKAIAEKQMELATRKSPSLGRVDKSLAV
jgi:hypothetical protein